MTPLKVYEEYSNSDVTYTYSRLENKASTKGINNKVNIKKLYLY